MQLSNYYISTRYNFLRYLFMKNLRYLILLLIVGIVPPTSLEAANLIDVYREALEHDAQYKVARHAYRATQEKLPQGRAGLLPNIEFTGRERETLLHTDVRGENFISNRGLVITATQPLFRVENFIIYEQSKNEVAQGDARFILSAQDLILRLTQAYFDTLIAQVNVEAAEAQEKAFRQQLELMRHNLEFGLGTIVDTNEAESRHDLAVSQEIAARNALEISKRNLQSIINRFPNDLTSVSIDNIVSDPLTMPYGNMEELVASAENKNYLLKIQQLAYEIAQQETSRAKAGHYPTLDLVGQYNNQINQAFIVAGRGIDFESKFIGVELRIPVFQGFSTQSRAREMLANQDKARDELENIRRIISLQVRQHYLNITNGIAQVKALKKAVISSRSHLDSTILGQKSGIRIEIDVLNAQQQYFSARKDLVVAYYNYLMSRLRLKANLGELDESVLEEINAFLRG